MQARRIQKGGPQIEHLKVHMFLMSFIVLFFFAKVVNPTLKIT